MTFCSNLLTLCHRFRNSTFARI